MVVNNLQRTVSVFLIKTVFAAVLTTLFLFGTFKHLSASYPFELKNMLIWEVLSIGIGSLFLSLQPNDERIKSKFLINVVFRLVPAALVQIGLVVFFFTYCKDKESAQVLSVLAFSIFSFVIFIRVCMPFDVYRTFLVIGLTFIGIVVTLADVFAKQISLFGINYGLVTGKLALTLILSLVVALAVYGGLSFGSSELHKYLDKKREERKYDYF